MKTNHPTIFAILFLAVGLPLAGAGEPPLSKDAIQTIETPPLDPWADVRRPITNPTLFDLALPQTQVHPLVIHNLMPDIIDTTLGPVPLGGSYQVYALQVEVALTERLSINATKDGYIVFNPDHTLDDTSGWANIAAGIKYAWLYRPEQKLVSNIQLLYEIPSGDRDVWQGEGDGVFIPSASVLKLAGPFQIADTFGFKVPVDNDAESTMFYNSAHISYAVTDWFFPMVELNWFHVIDPGDGGNRFSDHIGGLVPAVARFEAGDLVNWGASNASAHRNLVTLGVGFRARCPSKSWPVDVGFAWEFPLTDNENGILDHRFTFDAVIRF